MTIVVFFLSASSLTLSIASACKFTYMCKYIYLHICVTISTDIHTCDYSMHPKKFQEIPPQYISWKLDFSLQITLHFSINTGTSPSSGCPGVLLNAFPECDIKTCASGLNINPKFKMFPFKFLMLSSYNQFTLF